MVQTTQEVVIVDNGAYSVRVGTSRDAEPRLVPNCIFKSKNDRKRVYVGPELDDCADRSGIFYMYTSEKGYTVNWDVQQQIWDRALAPYLSNARNSKLVLTDLNYLIPAIKDQSYEIIFEQYEFGRLNKSSAPAFSSLSCDTASLVIDVGFSCTTIAAFFEGQLIHSAVIRIDLGGKMLTNQLKEWISYREVNVMEETYVVNECKEDCCFVSLNCDRDLQEARLMDGRNTIRREYVLPDFMEQMRGYIRGKDEHVKSQVITMNHERFMVPEALFRPSNIGFDQMGVAEAAAEVINRCPKNLRCTLARNIIVTGGSSKFPNFTERLKIELNSLLDYPGTVKLISVDNPITHAWTNARNSVANGQLRASDFISRHDWAEHGDAIAKRFQNFVDN